MNIGRQWTDRLKIWAEALPGHYVSRAEALNLEYCTTFRHLSLEDAGNLAYSPAPTGMTWGEKWEYGWFRTRIVIPETLAGQRVVFTLGCGEEMLVYVNGCEAGAIDKQHKFITLTTDAVAGRSYDILAECYAGHGVRNEGAGIVAWGAQTVPEPPKHQLQVVDSWIGVWNEPVFQAAMDYLCLYSLVKRLPPKSLRFMKVIEALKKFTYIADLELPEPQLTASVVEAAKVLQPLLKCKNGTTAPEFTIFGQSHLDMAWLWTAEETVRKSARTYANQLALMEEYGDYRFLLCEPPILENLKRHYPNVWRRVKERVQQGAFLPEGAMWIECDTNIPSGESLIRQMVWGKRWFRRELGVDSRMAWMPDTFGFSAALPQILKKSQIPYFATQKLTRQDPECEPFPYNVFWWQGLDGSKVLTHLFKKNNARFEPADLITRWEDDRIQQENIDGMIYPFGFGDGGGGPTRQMLEMARRCADLEGAPRCRMESPVDFLDRQINVENTYVGELYLAWHRGTLTSQAKTKQWIRWAEGGLRRAEYFLSRQMLSGKPMPENWRQRTDALWEKLLFNQFHDIAPGTSIARVHEAAQEQLQEVCRGCDQLIAEMLPAPQSPSATVSLHNTLSWPRKCRGVWVPAQGNAVVTLPTAPEHPVTLRYLERDNCYEMTNRHLVCRINARGELISVKRPGANVEYLAGAGNRFLMFKDVNTCYDAWELGSMYENLPVPLDEEVEIAMEPGEQVSRLKICRHIGASALTQEISLGADEDCLVFTTQIHWQERHKLLKVAFPVNAHASEAIHEVQFGYLKRPTHRSNRRDRDRYEVCNHRYTALTDGAHGAAVLNDSKYGVNVVDNEIRLTLLKSAMMPDQNADLGMQQFTYAFYPFDGAFAASRVLHKAAELNEPFIAAADEDTLGAIFLADEPNIVVDTVKPADTAENALMVRVYEAMGMQTDCAFTIHERIGRIEETDMLEENPREVDSARVHFEGFEIKTFMLYL